VNDAPSDARLLERIRNSDMEAFRILFELYHPVLFRHVLFQTRQSDTAHDIAQETFIRVWEHRRKLDPRLSFPAYIIRISGNLVRDDFRRRKRREKLDPEIPLPGRSDEDDPLGALETTMLEEELGTVVENLPERCRAVFLLSRIEEKTNREIAGMLGISIRTVEHQISHALNVIRKKLGRHLRRP
jgi:RNA polymerase sigma-70 factor (ECF subfamily)